MCGISVIINKQNIAVNAKMIEDMNHRIAHRGPDGDGFFYQNNFAFGHRRLAILDLTEDGRQPMTYKEENVITFNGEIFNYLELREELIQKGYLFQSQSDTEVILAAYDCWGTTCVSRFNGMWSFCIWNKKSNQLFCSRDRFGVKPFYYTENDDFVAFGSEIRQMLPFQSEIKANRQQVLEYIITASEEFNNETFFVGIKKLEQGHNLIYDLNTHQISIEKYYTLEADPTLQNVSEAVAVEKYKNQLTDAVRVRMRSDVEVGTCLSGGLDSSTITAISSKVLAEESSNEIKAIHAKASEKAIDESDFATQVAAHTKAELNVIEPTYQDFLTAIDKIVEVQEEPFGSPSIVLQYYVLKEARAQNCIVMLDGQGGDETLLGYPRYYPAFLLEKKGWSRIREFFNSANNSHLSKVEMLKYYFYFTNYKLRLKYLKRRNSFVKKEILDGFQSPILQEITNKYTDISALQKLEITKTQLPHLLKYEDKNSMANSVETRLPFLDYRCVELAISLPNEYKIKEGWTKFLLRKVIEDQLPKEVVWRKNKLGFNAPEKTWLDNHAATIKEVIEKSPILNKILDKQKLNIKQLDLRTQWRLFNVARWEQVFKVEW